MQSLSAVGVGAEQKEALLDASAMSELSLDSHFAQLKAREAQLRALDEQLNARKADLIRRVEDKVGSSPAVAAPAAVTPLQLPTPSSSTSSSSRPATRSSQSGAVAAAPSRTKASARLAGTSIPPSSSTSASSSRTPSQPSSRRSSLNPSPRPSPPTLSPSTPPPPPDDDPTSSSLSSSSTLRFQKTRIVALNESLTKVTGSYAELKERYTALQRREEEREEERKRRDKEASKQREDRERRSRELDTAKADVERLTRELNSMKKDKGEEAGRRREEEREDKLREAKLKAVVLDNERLRKRVDALEGVAKGDDAAAASVDELSRLRRERAKLLSQRAEMVAAFKKQMRLIDVLKRQKTHLEAARMLQFTEQEFTAALDVSEA